MEADGAQFNLFDGSKTSVPLKKPAIKKKKPPTIVADKVQVIHSGTVERNEKQGFAVDRYLSVPAGGPSDPVTLAAPRQGEVMYKGALFSPEESRQMEMARHFIFHDKDRFFKLADKLAILKKAGFDIVRIGRLEK